LTRLPDRRVPSSPHGMNEGLLVEVDEKEGTTDDDKSRNGGNYLKRIVD
jgi:hypothetical protein